jgi:hypothetical protein
MINFFTHPETNRKLFENQTKGVVFLAGGYDGYYYNFGDLLQLKGALNWYKKEDPKSLLCPLIHLAPVSNKAFIEELSSFFRTSDFIFYAFEEEDFKEKVAKLSLEPLQLPTKLPTIVFHLYGGGFFNRFWGEFKLKEIEGVLESFPVDHYIISGQQIDDEFVPTLTQHLRKYQPDLIGCRDLKSVEILAKHGITAKFSSDDAFEELLAIVNDAKNLQNLENKEISFALNMNLSYYVLSMDEAFFERLDRLLNLLSSKTKDKGIPIFVESYLTQRDEVQNMWLSIKKTLLTKYFPKFLGIDLAGALLKGELNIAGSILRLAPLFIANSYHTALFGKMLGIPTYLLSFNDYYSQKQAGIEVKQRTLEEFLDEDPEVILKEQETTLKIHEEARAKWLKELKEVLSYEPKKAYLRAISYYREEVARLKVSLEEKERLFNELKSEVERLSEENITLKKHNNLLAEEVNRLSSEIFHLKERLSFIENSRSWRFVEAWWRVNAHPIGRIVFFPIVKLIHLLWRK